jgi:hypothetical protein
MKRCKICKEMDYPVVYNMDNNKGWYRIKFEKYRKRFRIMSSPKIKRKYNRLTIFPNVEYLSLPNAKGECRIVTPHTPLVIVDNINYLNLDKDVKYGFYGNEMVNFDEQIGCDIDIFTYGEGSEKRSVSLYNYGKLKNINKFKKFISYNKDAHDIIDLSFVKDPTIEDLKARVAEHYLLDGYDIGAYGKLYNGAIIVEKSTLTVYITYDSDMHTSTTYDDNFKKRYKISLPLSSRRSPYWYRYRRSTLWKDYIK